MISYQLDYVVDEIRKNEPSDEQKYLKKYVGSNYSKEEADFIWERVIDHKWYIGERLKRDVGLRVAAVDYIENFYDAGIFRKNNQTGIRRFFSSFTRLTRSYFVSKSKFLPNL
jgi:hypothetical protein